MRYSLLICSLCFLTTCGFPEAPIVPPTQRAKEVPHDWGMWASELETAVEWREPNEAVMVVSFPAKVSVLQNLPCPEKAISLGWIAPNWSQA